MLYLDSNAHSVFALHYHLIMTTKYRRRVFNDVISDRAKEIFLQLPDPITSLFKNGTMMSIIFISCSLLTLTLVLQSLSMHIRVPVHVY